MPSGVCPPLQAIQAAFSGSYQSIRQIASGGQGAVFEATSTGTGKQVALKLYFPGHLSERTAREVAALKKLKGETIVRLEDSGSVQIAGEDLFFMATTLISGTVLLDALRAGALPLKAVCRIGADISCAVDEMWALDRIVHRDIKPGNVMLRSDGRAILIDLGIARHLNMATLTSSGSTWGTDGYMSPEQARGKPLSCKSDIFALGIVLQECISGKHPVARNQYQLKGGGPPTSALIGGLPAQVDAIITSMVDREPYLRPHPRAVIAELSTFC